MYKRQIQGCPINVVEMLAPMKGVAYAARVSLHDYANVLKAKKAVKKAFEMQIENKGFSIVEILSTCPTNWGLSPLEALEDVYKRQRRHCPCREASRWWRGRP